MSDLFSSSSSFQDDKSSKEVDNELQEFLMAEKQKAQFQAQVKIFQFKMYICEIVNT
ncbi:translocase of inner membrane 8 isoform X2 [Colletes latitarsis]|uniref:translocase of inner membrane 8 isoform X2 n=1 Tax=Colletes latitarsis TaxID=2605962 RepID=UPI004036E618